jgi:tetratricopeptide (TPR) repeat protein
MSLTGSLKTMHLGDLLQWCGSNLKTGTLRLTRGPIEKRLFFKDGRLFSSTSNSPRETLGQFLIRAGKISEEELFKALIQQDRAAEPLGQILIGGGLLSEEELNELLRLKTGESIYDCFLWSDGDFVFEDGRLPEKISIYVPLDLTAVILEGARRTDEWDRIWEVFPSRFTTFTAEPTDDGGGELSAEDNRILDLVSQGKNLGEIALELHAVDFYAASRLLELHERGLVHVSSANEEIPFEQQIEELRDKLREGVVCFNAGQYSDALSAFDAALAIDPQNKYARLFSIKVQKLMEDARSIGDVPLDGVPVLKLTLEELADMELDPQEGFVLSRVNGEWSVRSILKICPMRGEEVLIIFKRLMDNTLIEFQ